MTKNRKTRKRLWALLLSAALIVTQLPAVAMAENHAPEDGSIASFEELPSGVAKQTVDVGTELSGLNLPDTVTASVYHVTEDMVIPDEDGPDGDSAEESDDPATASPSDAENSVSEGKYVFTADVDGSALSDSAKLPQITVTVAADTVEKPTESQPGEPISCTQTEGCTLPDGHEGDCVPAPPSNDSLVKTITGWTFVDDENSNVGKLPLINVSMEQQADFDTVVSMLPTQISADIEGEAGPDTLDITDWICPEYIQDGDGNWPLTGTYTFTAALTGGYACEPLPTAKVLLGGANTYAADNTLTEGGLTVAASNGGEVEYTKGSGFTLKTSGDYTISGTWNVTLNTSGNAKKAVITVPSGVTADVTLNGVTINISGTLSGCAFAVAAGGTANIILAQDSNNTLSSGWNRAGLEVSAGAAVTIDGSGSLTANSRSRGAGIGGGNDEGGGTIEIKGGTVEANGSEGGAGIGGGYGGGGGTITIKNGTIVAKGGSHGGMHIGGAGIGGGGGGGGGETIEIKGGTVEANGSDGGAGIGGGGGGGGGGTIKINGGTVTANGGGGGGTGGAGIGGGGIISGGGGGGGTVEISGKHTEVIATGGNMGSDVGNGYLNSGGTLSVTGGASLEMKNNGTNVTNPEYKDCTVIDKDGLATLYDENGNKIAETPAITSQPQNHTINVGGSVTLSVTASVADGGTISYQWYSNTRDSNTGGNAISGADTASYTVPTGTAGTTYYYVVVTNTNDGVNGNKMATATSNTAKVTVNTLVNAETPVITNQPTGGTYTQNTSATLTVTANVSDGGNLTYQWYSNTTNSNAGGSAISGADTASYTAPTGTAGTTYYYVVITNTNNGVSGQKTANITSSVAAVMVKKESSNTGGNGGSSSYTEPEPQSSYTVAGDNISRSVSRSDLKKLADNGKSLTLRCEKASMTFDPAALKAILAAVPATAGNITFTAVPADLSAFPDAAAQISTRPVYDFTISYKDSKGNSVVVPVSFPTGSASISLNYTLAAAEVTGSLFMVYVDGKGAVTWLDKSSYGNGKVLAEVPHFSTYGVTYKAPAPVFTDIANHWAKADIEFVAARGLLSDTGNNLFSPDGTMTRGMFVTALGRLAGINPDSYQTRSFTDVKTDAYYAAYVEWAAQKNIGKETGEGLFSPDAPVTREQMAVMMTNYAGQMGYSIPTPLASVTFADNANISEWAAKEVAAMQRAGIIKGKDGNRFDPQASATRAEVSAVLRRFVEIVIDPVTAQGWVKNDSGQWLYYKDGKALTGWQTISKLRYFFNADGVMHEGWKQDTGTNKWYYWTNAGAATGWKEIGGKWYYFDENGVMSVNTTIDGYEIGPDGTKK